MNITLATIQMDCEPFEVKKNLQRAADFIAQATRQDARLVVLPEFFNIGYAISERLFEYAEQREGPTVNWMKEISTQKGIYLSGCIYEREGEDYYDTMVLTTPEGDTYHYRKRHPAFWENILFLPGDTPGVFETGIGRIGMAICWDMVYRDTLDEILKQGAELVLISSAWPSINIPRIGRLLGRLDRSFIYCIQEAPRKIAREAKAPVVFANRAGSFSSRIPLLNLKFLAPFYGQSCIVSSQGEVLTRLDRQEGLAVKSIPLKPKEKVAEEVGGPKKYPGRDYIVPIPRAAQLLQHIFEKRGRKAYFKRKRGPMFEA